MNNSVQDYARAIINRPDEGDERTHRVAMILLADESIHETDNIDEIVDVLASRFIASRTPLCRFRQLYKKWRVFKKWKAESKKRSTDSKRKSMRQRKPGS